MEKTSYIICDVYEDAIRKILKEKHSDCEIYSESSLPDEYIHSIPLPFIPWDWKRDSDFYLCSERPVSELKDLIGDVWQTVPLKRMDIGFFLSTESDVLKSFPLFRLPKRRWGWVRLSGSTTEEETEGFLSSLLDYNRNKYSRPLAYYCLSDHDQAVRKCLGLLTEMMKIRHIVIRGGIRFLDYTHGFYPFGYTAEITPGCCGGLEDWYPNAYSMRVFRSSPWMGHDPNVSFAHVNGHCIISTDRLGHPESVVLSGDEGTDEQDAFGEKIGTICYPEAEFDRLLMGLKTDFDAFVNGPLTAVIRRLDPEKAGEFLEAFRYCFVRKEDL